MRFWLFLAIFALTFSDVAHASGPVERLVQVLLHPTDPNIMVVRWGVASEGYLFSRDGGKTFAALCSSAVTPLAGLDDAGISPITKVSSNAVFSNVPTLLDGEGKLLLTQLSGLWSDDGTGCSWTRALSEGWPTAIALDTNGDLLVVLNVTSDDNSETRSLLLRRSNGAWTPQEQAGALVAPKPGQHAYGGELKVIKTATGTRLYASVPVSQGASNEQVWYVVKSDDGGKTWSAGTALPPEQSESFSLVTVDPTNPDRLLAALTDDLAADVLLLSEDGGATFKSYGQVRELTGAAFAPDGTVYLTDQGDAADVGGLWKADKLGQPLSKVEGTAGLDCVTWSQANGNFYVCQGDRVRVFDPTSMSFVGGDVVRISSVPKVLSCSNADIEAVCQDQLNAGASWCCTGHYPCTPFCGDYDVTKSKTGQRVFCGKSGLEYDLMAGRTCEMESANTDGGVAPIDAGTPAPGDAAARDAGTIDAGKVTDGKPQKKDDGCALSSSHKNEGVLISFGLVLWAGRGLRRRRLRK